jgi:hypothetical protein
LCALHAHARDLKPPAQCFNARAPATLDIPLRNHTAPNRQIIAKGGDQNAANLAAKQVAEAATNGAKNAAARPGTTDAQIAAAARDAAAAALNNVSGPSCLWCLEHPAKRLPARLMAALAANPALQQALCTEYVVGKPQRPPLIHLVKRRQPTQRLLQGPPPPPLAFIQACLSLATKPALPCYSTTAPIPTITPPQNDP